MQAASLIGKHLGYAPLTRLVPDIEIEDSRYVVRLAKTVAEIESALKLRFEVFNLELGEGLESSFRTGRDRDEFDDTCDHLIVTEKTTNKTIGTYRLRTLEMARTASGFYSAGEFHLNCLPLEVLTHGLELGRACIARAHRDRHVLFLLWKALARYVAVHHKRFLFGCCSLTSQDPNEGNQLLKQLSAAGHMHPSFWAPAKPGYECLPNDSSAVEVKIPKLFRTYLSIGAQVCGPPAIDRQFKTIDFLVMFDIRQMSARTRKLFDLSNIL